MGAACTFIEFVILASVYSRRKRGGEERSPSSSSSLLARGRREGKPSRRLQKGEEGGRRLPSSFSPVFRKDFLVPSMRNLVPPSLSTKRSRLVPLLSFLSSFPGRKVESLVVWGSCADRAGWVGRHQASSPALHRTVLSSSEARSLPLSSSFCKGGELAFPLSILLAEVEAGSGTTTTVLLQLRQVDRPKRETGRPASSERTGVATQRLLRTLSCSSFPLPLPPFVDIVVAAAAAAFLLRI